MTNTRLSSSPIQAVLFDLDNTLFDRDLAFSKWASGFVDEQFAGESADYRAQVLQKIIAIDAHGYVTKHTLFTQIKTIYPIIAEEVEALCEQFYQEWLVHMALDADTTLMLDFLDQTGIPFGIITNGPVQQHLKIRQLGLHHRTRCLFVSAEFGCNKPDPAIFRAAASCLGVPCERILFVGDNPEADICGAHGVGMKTAWLSGGTIWPETISKIKPDFALSSLKELTRIIHEALADTEALPTRAVTGTEARPTDGHGGPSYGDVVRE